MSSNEEELANGRKKRKLMPRACDNCRKKKVKCDELTQHGKCSKCFELKIECTFSVERKKRGLPKGYVEELEHRIQILESVVIKLCPDKSTLHTIIHKLDPEYAEYLAHSTPSQNLDSPSTSTPTSSLSNSPPSTNASSDPPEDTEIADVTQKVVALTLGSGDDPFRDHEANTELDIVSERLKLLSIETADGSRFFGKSSAMVFMHGALVLKNKYGKEKGMGMGFGENVKTPTPRRPLQDRRMEFWGKPNWYFSKPRPVNYAFPPADLIPNLIEAYFAHVNLFCPLLHKPTFERAVSNNLHLLDEGFGSVLLLVCAIGSRYTDEIDKRTLLDGEEENYYSAGWRWFEQVEVVKLNLDGPPTLYDLQVHCLAVQFLGGSCAPEPMWLLAGYGIRLAQDVGVHRRRVPREKLTVEDELWKRVFWVLIFYDRMISVTVGRPCAICDEYFDLDMPMECDDEFWEHPDPMKRFIQSEGVPSTVTSFVHHLRLSKILTFSVNTIYSIKTKWWVYVLKSDWEKRIVAELDSALNNWMNALPDHLRWDPTSANDRFFKLSASLMTAYYYVQMMVHRTFILDHTGQSPTASPSLAICTNAARSCSRVLEQFIARTRRSVTAVGYPYIQMSCMTAAIVLLVSTWSKGGGSCDEEKTMKLVERCKDVLRIAEKRWHSAGALLDVLNEFTTPGEILLPEDDPALLFGQVDAELPMHFDNAPSTAFQPDFSGSVHAPPDLFSEIPGVQYGSYAPNNTINQQHGTHMSPPVTLLGRPFHDGSSSSMFDIRGPVPSSTPGAALQFENFDSNTYTTPQSNTWSTWFTPPNSYQLDEWNSFVAGFTELTNGLNTEVRQV